MTTIETWTAPANPSDEWVEHIITWCAENGLDANRIMRRGFRIERDGDTYTAHYLEPDYGPNGEIVVNDGIAVGEDEHGFPVSEVRTVAKTARVNGFPDF